MFNNYSLQIESELEPKLELLDAGSNINIRGDNLATIADVFIIESLDPDDEGNGRLEGNSITHLLRLHGKRPIYHYVRTRESFEEALVKFSESNYRYLHISAHAESEGLITTNQDEIDYDELAHLLGAGLKNKRLFLSACSLVHEDMAKEMITKTDCVSVVGPRDNIRFSDAAVFWPAIYHKMFTAKSHSMSHVDLKNNLQDVANLFEVEIGYFSRSKRLIEGYTRDFLKKAR